MRLSVTGWNRNMGANLVGSPDVASAIPHGPSKDVTAIKKKEDEVLILWYSKYITLTGSYRVKLSLSKDDIVIIFKEFFGEYLNVPDLENNGFHFTNEGLKEKLLGMTVGELSELLSGGTGPSRHHDFSAGTQLETSK